MSDFYLVWNESGFPPRFRHQTRHDAQREAERLATMTKGQSFYVLHAVSVSSTPKPVETISLDGHGVDDDGLPF